MQRNSRRAAQSILWIIAITLSLRSAGLQAQETPTKLPTKSPTYKPIERLLPPKGIDVPAEVRAKLEADLKATRARYDKEFEGIRHSDVAVQLKAVDFALRFDEFYSPKDFEKAAAALRTANELINRRVAGKGLPERTTGPVVRSYFSTIDDSPQPYGLVIPKDYDFYKPAPLYVWLHGRGDKATDLHFIHERQTSVGQIAPPNAMVLHPFGRHCVGFQSAGEMDVLEAIFDVQIFYSIDPRRIVLIGFSMGGAGAWHVGAHYPGWWAAVAPGAGYAETARYQRLKPEQFPPRYEQMLWGQNDTPCYVRNLFNAPTIAYSGENDRQIQAARIMEEAFAAEGQKLTHLIGPGVEHKYEPGTLKELLRRLDAVVQQKPTKPKQLHFQTRTLAYSQVYPWQDVTWLEVTGLQQHWVDSRVDVDLSDATVARVRTKNVTSFQLTLDEATDGAKLSYDIDGQVIRSARATPRDFGDYVPFIRRDGRWEAGERPLTELHKRPGLQGPIDDAFRSRFVVVLPTGKSKFAQGWVDAELQHFRERWPALMRGDVRVVKDVDLDLDDEARQAENWILWGDPDSNQVLRKLADKLPVKWDAKEWSLGDNRYDRETHVPAFIYPNPVTNGKLNQRYIVVNSGLTFREAHDRTNSLQNPKLPDWAVIDIRQPPDAESPGKIVAADFFDEQWQLKEAR